MLFQSQTVAERWLFSEWNVDGIRWFLPQRTLLTDSGHQRPSNTSVWDYYPQFLLFWAVFLSRLRETPRIGCKQVNLRSLRWVDVCRWSSLSARSPPSDGELEEREIPARAAGGAPANPRALRLQCEETRARSAERGAEQHLIRWIVLSNQLYSTVIRLHLRQSLSTHSDTFNAVEGGLFIYSAKMSKTQP